MFCHFSDILMRYHNFPIVAKTTINDLIKIKIIHYYRTFMSWHLIIFTFLFTENNCYSLKIKTVILLWPVLIMIVYVGLLKKSIVMALKVN